VRDTLGRTVEAAPLRRAEEERRVEAEVAEVERRLEVNRRLREWTEAKVAREKEAEAAMRRAEAEARKEDAKREARRLKRARKLKREVEAARRRRAELRGGEEGGAGQGGGEEGGQGSAERSPRRKRSRSPRARGKGRSTTSARRSPRRPPASPVLGSARGPGTPGTASRTARAAAIGSAGSGKGRREDAGSAGAGYGLGLGAGGDDSGDESTPWGGATAAAPGDEEDERALASEARAVSREARSRRMEAPKPLEAEDGWLVGALNADSLGGRLPPARGAARLKDKDEGRPGSVFSRVGADAAGPGASRTGGALSRLESGPERTGSRSSGIQFLSEHADLDAELAAMGIRRASDAASRRG